MAKGGTPASGKKIFLSWAGPEARLIGEWFKKTIEDLPGWCAFISSEDIESGKDFFNKINAGLKSSVMGIGIMTEAALERPWFLYEISALKAQNKSVALLRFGDYVEPGHPLYVLNNMPGSKFEGVFGFLESLLSDRQTVALLNRSKPQLKAEWARMVAPVAARNSQTMRLRRASTDAIRAITDYKSSEWSTSHSGMQELARKTLVDLTTAFQGFLKKEARSYKIDYRRYPDFLVHLQKELEAKITAIAVVNEWEDFWANKTGNTILESTHSDSRRIFVFENADTLRAHFVKILLHARHYEVFVLSTNKFKLVRDRLTGDF